MILFVTLACVAPDGESGTKPGEGDDTAESPASILGAEGADVTWTPILTSDDRLSDPRDLGFDTDGNLWVANRADDRTFIVLNPGTDSQTVDRRKDGYAQHFMEEMAAFSFEGMDGASEEYGPEFGSCGESENTYNDTAQENEFMGPVLWATDLDIFAEQNPEGLGSHLDMQHESPLCVGIAWEKDNVYWVFDGYHDAIVRYDFMDDHDIGQDDHSDGIVYRYTEPQVTRVEEAPGHMVFDRATGMLYVADTGNGRILRLDTTTGEKGRDLRQSQEEIVEYAEWDGAEWSEVITGLDRPGGLALNGDRLLVGEWGTGKLYDYTLDGEQVRALDAGVGPEALYGIEVGPDGKLWVTETGTPAVVRLDVE